MNTIRTKTLITLSGGRWARIGFSVLLTSLFTVGAQAQTVDEGKANPLRNTNKELRTNTWSIYAQGGLSWANGVWYPNIDAKSSYKQSPAVGGGIDFTIRPWVRIGADYIWSRYRREQRFSVIDNNVMPVKTYGNYMMNTHNIKLGVQFNLMEFWTARKAQWFNIWLGTGLGGTLARGNEYGVDQQHQERYKFVDWQRRQHQQRWHRHHYGQREHTQPPRKLQQALHTCHSAHRG